MSNYTRPADGKNIDGSPIDYRPEDAEIDQEDTMDRRLLRRRLELKIESLNIMHRFMEAHQTNPALWGAYRDEAWRIQCEAWELERQLHPERGYPAAMQLV